jgi:ubiquinone/menaquinone biosynthesis C-methylase UbiE
MQEFNYKAINKKQKNSETDPFTPRRYHHFFDHFPKGDLSVLDVGCNTGRGGNVLKQLNPSLLITGLDCLKERLDQLNPDIYQNSICSTTLKIPIAESSFDIIVAGEFIEHLSEYDIKPTLKEFYRILRSNGLLMITTPNPTGIIMKLKGNSVIGGAHLSEHKAVTLKTTLRDLNYKEIKVEGTGRVSKYLGKKLPIFIYNSYLMVAKK